MEIQDTSKESESPSYSDLFANIKKHISSRSGLLLKRTLLICWPTLIYVFGFSVIKNFDVPMVVASKIYLTMAIMAPFAIIYAIVMTHIFSIEKIIWVDAYGDNKSLSPKESFVIARRLFWPTIKFKIYLFVRYYIYPLAIYLALLSYEIYLVFKQIYLLNIWQFISVFIIAGPIILWAYYYFLKIKLRYVWFIYLDEYKEGAKFDDFISKMKSLNEINKSESFKKSLAVDFGSDVLQNVTQLFVGYGFGWLGRKLGREAKVFGNVAAAYSNEVTSQASSLIKLAGNYVLYQYSREKLDGKPQIINENIYSIVE